MVDDGFPGTVGGLGLAIEGEAQEVFGGPQGQRGVLEGGVQVRVIRSPGRLRHGTGGLLRGGDGIGRSFTVSGLRGACSRDGVFERVHGALEGVDPGLQEGGAFGGPLLDEGGGGLVRGAAAGGDRVAAGGDGGGGVGAALFGQGGAVQAEECSEQGQGQPEARSALARRR